MTAYPEFRFSPLSARVYFDHLRTRGQCFSVPLSESSQDIWKHLDAAIQAQFDSHGLTWASVSPESVVKRLPQHFNELA